MVLQVAKDESKEKEFAEVDFPLPLGDGSDEHSTADDFKDMPPFHVKRKKGEVCKICSIALNALLMLAVVLLAIKVCTLKKELDSIKDRDEFEITAKQANERDSSLDLKGDIPKEGHDRIQEMMDGYDEWWSRNGGVRFYVCFQRRAASSFWPW